MSEQIENLDTNIRIGVNFRPHLKILHEQAIERHPELGLTISEESIGEIKGYMSLRLPKGNESICLSDYWRTFWRLQREMNIPLVV